MRLSELKTMSEKGKIKTWIYSVMMFKNVKQQNPDFTGLLVTRHITVTATFHLIYLLFTYNQMGLLSLSVLKNTAAKLSCLHWQRWEGNCPVLRPQTQPGHRAQPHCGRWGVRHRHARPTSSQWQLEPVSCNWWSQVQEHQDLAQEGSDYYCWAGYYLPRAWFKGWVPCACLRWSVGLHEQPRMCRLLSGSAEARM